MLALRKIVLVSTVAIVGALSVSTAQADHRYHSYNSDLRYCGLSFHRMVDLFGYGNAKDLKAKCRAAGLYRYY